MLGSVREHLKLSEPIDDRNLINADVGRAKVQQKKLLIRLTEQRGTDAKKQEGDLVLQIFWRKVLLTRRREILLPEGIALPHARAMRAETCAT
jgi:hypothetical protein